MKNIYVSLLVGIFHFQASLAQQTGKVNYEQLGISFTIPTGWAGQETNDIYLITSQTKAGAILLSIEDYTSQDQMKTDMEAGYREEGGTDLKPSSPISQAGNNTLGIEYTGMLEGQSAKAYVTGTINPYGQDVFIMAVTTADIYSDEYKQLAIDLKKSLVFAKPEATPASEDWKTLLSGVKLTYMDSYSSNSYSAGGVSGGYSTENVFDLCSQGFFIYYGSDNMTVGGSASSGYSSSSGRGSGQWEVAGNTLRLKFQNGKIWEYELSLEEGKTYLNGKRYFRTWDGDYAPKCD